MNTFKLRITGDLGFEIWQDIPGYEGLYQASTYGRIIGLPKTTTQSGLIKAYATGKKKQYLAVKLFKGSKNSRKSFYIHRLIAETFIPSPKKLPYINHIDENPSNNSVDNLEWCTAVYNNNFGTHNARMAASKSKAVLQFDMDGIFVKRFSSARDVERMTGYSQANISACCRNEWKQAYGFKWAYAES